MKINLEHFRDLEKQKYLSCQKHPTADLLIWNYTQLCQFARAWTEETMMARGLITDLEGNIKSRPFKKFFNYDEHFGDDSKLPALPLEKFTVTEKMDGSLGISYFIGDEMFLATRGSFISDQAIKGTEMLRKCGLNKGFDPDITALFEIIYPENRIVVDYGGVEELVLLSLIKTESGDEMVIPKEADKFDGIPGMRFVKSYDFDDIEKIKEVQENNKEGFVIRFESGVRTKIKMAEYVRLHRLVTGVNAKTIWELLKNHHVFADLLERVPDEFYDWVKKTKDDLVQRYTDIEKLATVIFKNVGPKKTRKGSALEYAKFPEMRGILFKMLDGQSYEEMIWKMIKPKADKPWKEEQE